MRSGARKRAIATLLVLLLPQAAVPPLYGVSPDARAIVDVDTESNAALDFDDVTAARVDRLPLLISSGARESRAIASPLSAPTHSDATPRAPPRA